MRQTGSVESLFSLPPFFDFVDILNCVITNAILAFCVCLTMVYQNLGHPMKCIVATKPVIWQSFYNEYCFTQGRFQVVDNPIHLEAMVPTGYAWLFVRNFQWMPYLFILQLVLFATPKFAWTVFALSFKNVNHIVSTISQARCVRSLKGEARVKEIDTICEFLLQCLGSPERRREKHQGRITVFLYVIQKWLQVLNLLVQFGICMILVDSTSIFWGLELMSEVFVQRVQETLRKFPKRATCFIPNDYGYSEGHFNVTAPNRMIIANCIIPINEMYEKLYVFLYFWYVFLLVVSISMALHYTLFLCLARYRMFCTSKFLPSPENMAMGSALEHASQLHISSPSNHLFEYFVNSVLMADGCMALWFIKESAGSRVAGELAQRIWNASVSRAKCSKPLLPIRGSLDYLGSVASSSRMQPRIPLYPGEKLSTSNLMSRSTSLLQSSKRTPEQEKFMEASKQPANTSKSSILPASSSTSSDIIESSSSDD